MFRKSPAMRSPSSHPGSTSPGRDRKPLETESVNAPTVECFENDGSDRRLFVRGDSSLLVARADVTTNCIDLKNQLQQLDRSSNP